MEKAQLVQQLHNQLMAPQSNQFEHSPSDSSHSPSDASNPTQRSAFAPGHLPYEPIAPYTPTSLQKTHRIEDPKTKAAVGATVQSPYEQIVALLSANQRMSAFELMLQSEDDMLLIRILSKEKSKFFVVDFDRLSFRAHHA